VARTVLSTDTVADELHVQITWKCAECPATSLSSFMAPVDRAPQIQAPPGWSIALGSAYCPRHRVDLKLSYTNLREMPLRGL
jgi:hypothetical protein